MRTAFSWASRKKFSMIWYHCWIHSGEFLLSQQKIQCKGTIKDIRKWEMIYTSALKWINKTTFEYDVESWGLWKARKCIFRYPTNALHHICTLCCITDSLTYNSVARRKEETFTVAALPLRSWHLLRSTEELWIYMRSVGPGWAWAGGRAVHCKTRLHQTHRFLPTAALTVPDTHQLDVPLPT